MKFALSFLLAATFLAGAASAEPPEDEDDPFLDMGKVRHAAGRAVSSTTDGVKDAALLPLEDLNLRKEAIPEAIAELDGYANGEAPLTCAAISTELHALDGALGVEGAGGGDKPISSKVAGKASDAMVDVVAGEVKGLIPFRGTIRKLSGAEKHEKNQKRAVTIGKQRRAYLRGAWTAMACDARPDDSIGRLTGGAARRPIDLGRRETKVDVMEAPLEPIEFEDLSASPPSETTGAPEDQEKSHPKLPSLG